MLDLQNDSELCEGKTTEIFVSRYRLFDDAMKEILRDDPPAIDFSVPLEVIFTGEGAQDYGGPRREFLGMVMREIRDKLFKEEGEGYIIFEKKKHWIGNSIMELASFLVNMQSLLRHLCHFHLSTQEFQFTFLLQVSVCCKVVLCLLSLLKTSFSESSKKMI